MAGRLDAEDDQLLIASDLVLLQKHPGLKVRGDAHPEGVIRIPAMAVVRSVRRLSPSRCSVPDEFHGPGTKRYTRVRVRTYLRRLSTSNQETLKLGLKAIGFYFQIAAARQIKTAKMK